MGSCSLFWQLALRSVMHTSRKALRILPDRPRQKATAGLDRKLAHSPLSAAVTRELETLRIAADRRHLSDVVPVPKGQPQQSPGRDTASSASLVAALGMGPRPTRSPNGTALITSCEARAATSWLTGDDFIFPRAATRLAELAVSRPGLRQGHPFGTIGLAVT